MHPIEAVSILSQLAYLPPATAATFADAFTNTYGYGTVPEFAPVAPYTPLYTDFTYASNFCLEPNTPIQEINNGRKLVYEPGRVGKQPAYERTLFHMTRDLRVLEALDKAKPAAAFYCVRNEDPIESKLSEAAFKAEFNVATVYPCTGLLHDEHVPKCVCPAPAPPIERTALMERIKAHRRAAPFKVRLRDLHVAVADAHLSAIMHETNQFPSLLLANFTSSKSVEANTKQQGGVNRDDDDYYKDYYDAPNARGNAKLATLNYARKQAENALKLKREKIERAAAARAAADEAVAELADYIATNENDAFNIFKPSIRRILTRARENTINGYEQAYYPLSTYDIDLRSTRLDDPNPTNDNPADKSPPEKFQNPVPVELSGNEPSEQWSTSDDDSLLLEGEIWPQFLDNELPRPPL